MSSSWLVYVLVPLIFTIGVFAQDKDCDPGWFGGTADLDNACFLVPTPDLPTISSYCNARFYCAQVRRDAFVAEIRSRNQQNFLVQELPKMSESVNLILGATADRSDRNIWTWESGHDVQEFFWKYGQPDNYRGEEDCINLQGDDAYTWNDVSCYGLDKPLYMPWGKPVKPLCQYNIAECEQGWIGGTADLDYACYLIPASSTGGMSMQDTEDYCTNALPQESSRLAEVTTQKQQDFLAENLKMAGIDSAWLGATAEIKEGPVWSWKSGAGFDNTFWHDGEPVNDSEVCLAMHALVEYRWMDTDCALTQVLGEPAEPICQYNMEV